MKKRYPHKRGIPFCVRRMLRDFGLDYWNRVKLEGRVSFNLRRRSIWNLTARRFQRINERMVRMKKQEQKKVDEAMQVRFPHIKGR